MKIELRNRLIKALLGTPFAASREGRDAMLYSIKGYQNFKTRDDDNPHLDISHIVEQLNEGFWRDNRNDFLTLIDTVLPAVSGSDAATELASIRECLCSVRPATYDLIESWALNLNLLVEMCKSKIPKTPSVTGFFFFCDSYRFLTNLQKRLKLSLKSRIRGNIEIRKAHKIKEIDTSADHIFQKEEKLQKLLKEFHLIIAIQVPHYEKALEVWRGFQDRYNGRIEKNHLFLLLEIVNGDQAPQGMIDLGRPGFNEGDVQEWVDGIIDRLCWPETEKIKDVWVNTILEECAAGTNLEIDQVYDHIHEMEQYFRDEISYEQFKSILMDR